ncbi:MAG: hypothetical protein AB8W33_13475 [Arsenophonus endosymbiont of Dermacentor nuttalli]
MNSNFRCDSRKLKCHMTSIDNLNLPSPRGVNLIISGELNGVDTAAIIKRPTFRLPHPTHH